MYSTTAFGVFISSPRGFPIQRTASRLSQDSSRQCGLEAYSSSRVIPESGVKRRASCVKWFELFDLAENFADQVAQHRRFFEPQYRTVLWASQFPGQEEEFVSQPSECEGLPRFLQAVPLKRGDKIVSESNDFQVQSV